MISRWSVSHGVDKALEQCSNSSDPEPAKYLLNSINKQAKAKAKKGYPKSQLKKLITVDQTNKIIDILIALNDVSLVQLFTSCFDKSMEIDFEVLTRLLGHFGFEALKPIFKEFIFPNNKKNISVNCRLIEVSIVPLISSFNFLILTFFLFKKILVNHKQAESGVAFFNETIKPTLSNHTAFSDLNIDVYSDLVKTIRNFENCNGYEEIMDGFKDAIIKTLKPASYEELFESFVKHIHGYSSIKQIIGLFKYRANWLKEKLKKAPAFSWSVPDANIPEHKEYEEFLKSERQEMTCKFRSMNDARNFLGAYNGNKSGYSTEMTIGGSGKKSFVKVTKTKKGFENYLKTLNKYRAELTKIKSFHVNV